MCICFQPGELHALMDAGTNVPIYEAGISLAAKNERVEKHLSRRRIAPEFWSTLRINEKISRRNRYANDLTGHTESPVEVLASHTMLKVAVVRTGVQPLKVLPPVRTDASLEFMFLT